jgi:hypothetical protein
MPHDLSLGSSLAGFDDPGHNIPGVTLPLAQWIGVVRDFFRDYVELNRLIQGQEHSDRLIIWATFDCIDDFNTNPAPFCSYGLQDFPSKHLLLRGTAINLLESLGLLMTRNHLTFSDGGVQVGVNDKTPMIQSWLQMFKNSYEEKKQQIKRQINIELGFGHGLHSEYIWTNGAYGGW